MSKVKIYVSRDPKTNEIHLRDSEGHSGDGGIVTNVRAGDEIEWIVGEGIDKIKGIYPAKDSHNVLSGQVVEKDGSWQGTVSQSAEGSETYVIEYEADSSAARADRPKLKVKPPQ